MSPHRISALLALQSWASPLVRGVHQTLAWGSKHTGLPVVVVAAVVLVVSFRVARHLARFAFQVAVVAALLVVATRLGWVRW